MERRSLGPNGENLSKTKYLKEKYAKDIEESRTFETKGLSEKEAKKFLKTEDGKQYIEKLQEADPSADYAEIRRRSISQIQSGSTLPVAHQTNSPLVKIVPKDGSVTPYSPYFTTEAQLRAAGASDKTLADHFGLPINSQADLYDIYKITPHGETTVFTSRVAPTSELGGLVTQGGGAEQTLILNRAEWSDPVLVEKITNMGVMQ